MTIENPPPPVPPEKVPAFVDSLEPELADAYRAGNPAVMQAIAGGATTTQQVVNDLIRNGAALSGLPPGVAQLLADRQKEIDLKKAEEDAALNKLVAGVAGAAIMASTEAKGMYYGGEGDGTQRNWCSNPPSSAEFAQMSTADRLAYYEQRQNTTLDQWAALDAATRDQHHQLDREQGDKIVTDNADQMVALVKEMQANLSKEQQAKLNSDFEYLSNIDATTPEGQARMRQAAKEMQAAHPDIPASYLDRYVKNQLGVFDGSAMADAGYNGQRANANGDIQTSHQQQQVAAQIGAKTQRAKLEQNQTLRADAHEEANAAMKAAAETGATGGAARVARDENVAVRVKADAAVAQADFAAKVKAEGANEDEFGDAPPVTAKAATAKQVASAEPGSAEFFARTGAEYGKSDVAAARQREEMAGPEAAPRLTIAASSLGLNGSAGLGQLGAAPEVAAANDPQGPKPAPKVASNSPGMGASA